MFERRTLGRLRFLQDYVRQLQESGPADEDLGNRLQRAGDELAEVEQLGLRARAKTAEAMRLARGALREGGIAVPALTREPTSPPGERPSPGPEGLVYATDAEPCVSCGEEVGSGPIGWSAEPAPGPLCDDCLLNRRASPLAIVLVLTHLMREIGEAECGSEEDERISMTALSTMAGGFERNVLQSWPPAATLMEPLLVELLEEVEERNRGKGGGEPGP